MFYDEEIQTLTELGLTERQSRVLLVLTKFGVSTARAIANSSQLPRQDVYKVLDELQELSFVEKKIGTPTEFAALPIHSTCTFLLARRVEKTSNLMSKVEKIVKKFKENNGATIHRNEPRLFLVPERQAFVHRIEKSVETAQDCIDVITPRKFLNQGLFSLTDALNKAMDKGVRVRFIIDCFREPDTQLSFPETIFKNLNLKMRTTSNHSCARFGVYDKKEVSVVLSLKGDFAKSSLLWSDSPSLAGVFQDYFEMLWLAATDNIQLKNKPPKIHDNQPKKSERMKIRRHAFQTADN